MIGINVTRAVMERRIFGTGVASNWMYISFTSTAIEWRITGNSLIIIWLHGRNSGVRSHLCGWCLLIRVYSRVLGVVHLRMVETGGGTKPGSRSDSGL